LYLEVEEFGGRQRQEPWNGVLRLGPALGTFSGLHPSYDIVVLSYHITSVLMKYECIEREASRQWPVEESYLDIQMNYLVSTTDLSRLET
jgi:hypothetical protein